MRPFGLLYFDAMGLGSEFVEEILRQVDLVEGQVVVDDPALGVEQIGFECWAIATDTAASNAVTFLKIANDIPTIDYCTAPYGDYQDSVNDLLEALNVEVKRLANKELLRKDSSFTDEHRNYYSNILSIIEDRP